MKETGMMYPIVDDALYRFDAVHMSAATENFLFLYTALCTATRDKKTLGIADDCCR